MKPEIAKLTSEYLRNSFIADGDIQFVNALKLRALVELRESLDEFNQKIVEQLTDIDKSLVRGFSKVAEALKIKESKEREFSKKMNEILKIKEPKKRRK